MGSGFKGKFKSQCALCGYWMERGVRIRRVDAGWGHVSCQKAIDKADEKAGADFIRSAGPSKPPGQPKYGPGEYMARLAVKADAYSESPGRAGDAAREMSEAEEMIREIEVRFGL